MSPIICYSTPGNRITMKTYCVIGNPVAHSQSPRIHTLFAEQTGRAVTYTREALDLKTFETDIAELFSDGLHGCNVTVPFKERALNVCAHLSERAQEAQAANTLIREADGRLRGDNTDGVGLARDLTHNHGVTLSGARILIAGAGGAARGIVRPLLDASPEAVVISNRTPSKADDLATAFAAAGPVSSLAYDALPAQPFDVLINATSTSLSGAVPPIPDHCLGADSVLYDLMYAKTPTAYLRWGQDAGASRLIDGIGMLVEQAAESFYLWEGVRPDTAPVIEALSQI
jgi:shikimate dehydrogenase